MNGVVINGCTFQGNRTIAIRGDAADTSQLEITARDNVITAGSPNQGNQGIEFGASTNRQVTFFDIDNNKVGTDGVTNSPLINTGINVSAGSNSTMTGKVRNNTVVNAGTGMSGFGIRVFQSSSATIVANVAGNTVSNVGLDYGILVESGGSSGATGAVNVALTDTTRRFWPALWMQSACKHETARQCAPALRGIQRLIPMTLAAEASILRRSAGWSSLSQPPLKSATKTWSAALTSPC